MAVTSGDRLTRLLTEANQEAEQRQINATPTHEMKGLLR